MFRFLTLIVFALAAAFVAAQSPETCILNCSANATGCVYTDLTCVCYNTDYQVAVVTCITSNCPDQLPAAQALQQQQCVGVSPPIIPYGTVSGNPRTPSGTPSGSPSAPGTSGTSTSAPASSETPITRPSADAPTSTRGAGFKNVPVVGAMGAMGALAALVGAAIF